MISREIMWNIPTSYKYIMYILTVFSLTAMFYGLYQKLQVALGPHSFKSLVDLRNLNWKNFFKTVFLQGRVKNHKGIGFIHALIYYGFFILWIATDLVAIHYDTPFKIFQGPVYVVISFLADIGGLMILVGLAMAYNRRYIQRPSYLESTNPKAELFMYVLLFTLVIIGFLIEGIRIYGTDATTMSMTTEKFIAPIGWAIARAFQGLNIQPDALGAFYRFLWFFHMVTTMLFIASIGFSKFSHIFLAPLSAFLYRPYSSNILEPMDFEREDVETFGLGKVSELTAKNRWDTQVCVECGRCTQSCPANLAGKPLDPKKIVTKIRDFMAESKDDFWESPIFKSTEIDSCTTCGACMDECPLHIEHVPLIMELKRYKVLTLGEIPPSAGDTTNKIKNNGNPWGITQEERFNWADGLDVPVIEENKKVDYLYYVGCAGSYDKANQTVVQDTVKLLKKAGVDFAVIGKHEKCNGDPVRRFGDEYSFFEIAIENIEALNRYSFDKIVTHCPHCLHTIGKEYAKFEGGEFETIHHTELLNDLIQSKKIVPTKDLKEERTFHDPCYLGRHHGAYSAPRNILESIPGVELKEMEKNKENALCCGMGGGNMWYEIDEGEHLAKNRLKDIAETKTENLSTACSYCMINFNSTKAQNGETENIAIEDIASTLLRSVD